MTLLVCTITAEWMARCDCLSVSNQNDCQPGPRGTTGVHLPSGLCEAVICTGAEAAGFSASQHWGRSVSIWGERADTHQDTQPAMFARAYIQSQW